MTVNWENYSFEIDEKTPSGEQCPWCADENSEFGPFDYDDAELTLCRDHLAEWNGTSLDGLDRQDAAEEADMAALGYFDQWLSAVRFRAQT